MSAISYQDQTILVDAEETVLDALLRAKQAISHGCKAGVCQSCIMVCEEGEIPLVAQNGLKDSQKTLNYFLPCQCKPDAPLKIAALDQDKLVISGTVKSKDWLNDHVIRLRLKVDMDFRAGQYVTLWKDDTIGRSYSIASLPEEGFIECHIKVIENGVFSQWIKDEVKEGQTIGVQGPIGLCFYQGDGTESLLLTAIGTGLAPIYGVLKDAINNHHSGQIDVVIGAKEITGFYLLDTLKQFAEKYSNITLHLICQQEQNEGIIHADMYEYTKQTFPSTKDAKAYLCGAESFVKKMKRQIFLGGASMSDIYSDSFVAS